MDLELLVRAAGRAVPVTVRADARATVGDLRRSASELLGQPVPPLPLPDDQPLTDAGLVRGATLGADPASHQQTHWGGKRPAWRVAVVGGCHAGPAAPLPAGGSVTVGRERAAVARSLGNPAATAQTGGGALVVSDPEVSRVHARFHAAPDGSGVSVADAGSTNGTRHCGWRIDGTATLTPGDVVAVGQTVLAAQPSPTADADLSTDPLTGDRLFNRPPRIVVPDQLPELLVPVEPEKPGGLRFPWAATLLPVLLCGALYLLPPMRAFGPYLLMMSALSPLMALANLISDRRSGRHEYTAKKAAYDTARAAYEVTLADVVARQETADRAAHPDPATLAGWAGVAAPRPAATLWQRRRRDPDFLRLRVGLVDRPARIALRLDGGRSDPPPTAPIARDVPVTVDLTDVGVLGLAGPRTNLLSAGRAVLAQAAVLHAPADLGVVLITGRDTADDWAWASWLPHTLPASSAFSCARLIATDGAQAEARLTELRRLVDERTAERRSTLAAGAPPGRAMLVVLDGARRLRDLPGVAELLSAGPAVGVYALCLDAEETALPDECRATVVATDPTGTRVRVRRSGLAVIDDVLVDGLDPAVADQLGRALAPLRVLGDRGGDSALPERVRFTELLASLRPQPAKAQPFPVQPAGGGARLDAAEVRAGWARSPQGRSTAALLGVGPDGPVTVDLRRDGPHALIAGTSGAGKSELLQTLVASLALSNSPDALTFVLVDYKGGSAFAACADLPHCVGLVTDLDGHLVNRALNSLSAELRRREGLFADAGAKDIDDYWARTGARLPRLVIVVDEFASLVEEVPEFVPGVIGIGMRGRSLGVHVVLATQRPAGVVTADLRANVNLRICLRVTAPAESADVIDTPDAARIPVRQPGRAYLRTGHSELTAFQAARVGWPVPDTTAAQPLDGPPVSVTLRRVEALGTVPAATTTQDTGATTRTDLSDLVGAVRAAAVQAGVAAPPRPWLPPLPDLVTLADLPPQADLTACAAVLGLVDQPAAQAQQPFVLDVERTGPVAVGGAVRAGRSTVLRTLATSFAAGVSPADLHLYALDCGNRAMSCLAALPHCGAVVDGDDERRVGRLLDLLHTEVAQRQRRLAAGGYGSLAEQRAAAHPDHTLPYLVLLLDGLEGFVRRYAERDGGRLVDRIETLLRTGPAVGVTAVLATDRTGFGHRVASAVAARLVLRQAVPDDAAAFGVDPRAMPGSMPPGRAIWASTGHELQVALIDPDPAGAAQAAAIERLAVHLAHRWDGVSEERLPRRVDPLPDEVSADEVLMLRRTVRPAGPAVCTPAVGGDQLGPIDLDLAASGGTFLVCGPPRAGRSTALVSIVDSLAGRVDGQLPVLAVAPRQSPLRELAGWPGVLAVLTGDPADIAGQIEDASVTGPVALVVDDAEMISDLTLTDALDRFARQARDTGSVLIAAATTEDAMASRYRGWLATIRRSRSGLLLNPTSHVDGEVFELRLPRSTAGGWPPGRALLVSRGEYAEVQVPLSGSSRQAVDG